jgi:hypothetical protein
MLAWYRATSASSRMRTDSRPAGADIHPEVVVEAVERDQLRAGFDVGRIGELCPDATGGAR